jgi:hypothetical protein
VVRDVSMVDASNGFATTAGTPIWKTVDGGANWTVAISIAGANLFGLSMLDASRGVATAGGGLTYTTTNGWATATTTSFNAYGGNDAVQVDANTAVMVAPSSSYWYTAADAGANAQVTDYGSAPNNWAGSGNSNMFGMCLQAINASTTAAPGWTVDGNGTCTSSDSDPWKAVPATITKLAYVSVAGNTGRADLTWGFRAANNQTPGTYSATVVFEALAPNV